MHIRRFLYSKTGNYIISILLGLGLATLFRRVCNSRSSLVFHGPPMKEIKGKTFGYDGRCYQFREAAQPCVSFKPTVEFA